jgi:hypothetical protein
MGLDDIRIGVRVDPQSRYTHVVRLTSHEIDYLSRKIVKALVAEEALEVDNPDRVAQGVAKALADELALEDRLNDEVRAALAEHTSEMERSDVTYNEMFKALKKKMAKEKGIIL